MITPPTDHIIKHRTLITADTSSIMPSKRMGTARAFVDHYATNQIEILQSLLAGGLAYTFSPSRSLDNAENLDKAGYIGFRQVMAAATTGYPLQVIKYIESESSNSKHGRVEAFNFQLWCLVLRRMVIFPTNFQKQWSSSGRLASRNFVKN